MSMNDFHRTPQQQIFSITAGANHTFGPNLVTYEFSAGRARYDGGFQFASWSGPGNIAFGVDTTKSVVPRFPVLSGGNIYDPTQYSLSFLLYPWDDHIHERDFTGSITLTRQYRVHSRFGAFEMGFKARDADKVRTGGRSFRPYTGATPFPMSSAIKTVPSYPFYFGLLKTGPLSDYSKIQQFVNSNITLFPDDPVSDNISNAPNQYDTSERVLAGYVMNTITLGQVRLQGGLRFEGTQGSFLGHQVVTDPVKGTFIAPASGEQTYVDVLPSVQFQYTFEANTKLRLSYGRGIARPNFADLPPSGTVDFTITPNQVTVGNPNLKPTHANNYDILLEHYLKTVGIIQVGWFYKAMTDPIYPNVITNPTTGPFTGDRVTGPINGPSAHITGIEMAWEQHLKFLPGLLNGIGVAANYSYTTSQASFPAGFGRTGHAAMLRQAPNNWNFDTTYDKGPISARMGLTHNDANIWAYQFQDNAPLGTKGPLGDQYLYPHTQLDAQVSYRIPRAHGTQAVVSLLNLNNEVFGFYFGSEKYPIQREYYSRTVSLGLRWTSGTGDLK